MLKKKNIAMMTAALTAATAVTPAFAAITTVKDMADETEKQAVLDEVKGYFETTYTEDTTELKDIALAGKSVYKVQVSGSTIGGDTQYATTAATLNTYAEFEAFMSKLKKNETATITVTDKGHRTVNGKIVDWDEYTFNAVQQNANTIAGPGNTTADTLEHFVNYRLENALEDNIIKVGPKDIRIKVNAGVTTATAGVDVVINEEAGYEINGDTSSALIFKVEANGTSKDFSKPIKDGNGYIVNFEDAKENIIEADKKHHTIQVKCTQDQTEGAEKVKVDAATLMEEGRFTVEGNELNNELKDLVDAVLRDENGNKLGLVASKTTATGSILTARADSEVGKTTAATMYNVTGSTVKYVDSKTSKFEITVRPDMGYIYENGNKFTATGATVNNGDVLVKDSNVVFNTNPLAVITIEGTHEDVKEVYNSIALTGNTPDVETLAGMDRYKTAVEVSKTRTTADTVVLVSGEVLVDGLTATPYAAAQNAPILLTETKGLNADTKEEIKRLEAKEVHIVGGEAAVSENVVSELRAMGVKVVRIYGQDRFETSVEVAKRLTTTNTVYVAQGDAMADALSISVQAAKTGQPILLTGKDNMPSEVSNFIKNNSKKAYVIGGEHVISKDVVKEIDKITTSYEILGGIDRYETNSKIMDKFAPTGKYDQVLVVNGDRGLVDALSAGAYASTTTGTVGLVLSGDDLTAPQKVTIKEDVKKTAEKVQVGYGVATKVIKTLKGLLK